VSHPVTQPARAAGPDRAPAFQRVAIVGLGLIGGSIALATRAAFPHARVIAVDNQDVLDNAMRVNAIDEAADDLAVLGDADLIILAAPVRQNLDILRRLETYVRQPAVITDTSSTKRAIVAAARALPEHLTFIGGHPLGGAAAGGIDHAHPDLFRGRPWLFTPDGDAHQEALERLVAFTRSIGADPRTLDAELHDRLLAFLSHLPQLTASALMAAVGAAVGDAGLALAGRGLVDTTRLASSPADMWSDIAATNADEMGPALDALIEILQQLRGDLAEGHRLREIFAEAGRWRAVLVDRPPV